MVVAFSNSGFEILAGIGVFAALGFMAQAAGTGVNDVVTQGIGLAFVAFPTIVSQAPFGAVMGVLFFGSLVFAGITSLISVLEVIVAAVQDKLGWGRVKASLVVSILVAAVSLAFFPTATGLYLLDTSDAFVNSFGITLGALVTVVVLAWFLRKLPLLSAHLNRISTVKMRGTWMVLVAAVVPLALIYMVANEFISKISTTYEGYPEWFVGVFGWGMSGALVLVALVLTFIPWSRRSKAHDDPEYDALVEEDAKEAAR
jgi:NSS family neurotransmitter:Na+ symporter